VAAIGAVCAEMVIMLGVYAQQSVRLSKADRELAAQQQINNGLQQQIAALQPFDELRRQVSNREALATSLLSGRVLWSGVLRDVSSALPGDLWLTTMSGTLNPIPAGSIAGATQVVGNIQFQGPALAHTTVASWLTRLEQVPGWVNAR
jgi:Tfp pilus assembly protein PilN